MMHKDAHKHSKAANTVTCYSITSSYIEFTYHFDTKF